MFTCTGVFHVLWQDGGTNDDNFPFSSILTKSNVKKVVSTSTCEKYKKKSNKKRKLYVSEWKNK